MSSLDPQTEKIITRLLEDVLAAGWLVSIDIGEDTLELERSADREHILSLLNATGQDLLILSRPENPGDLTGPAICLVYGNDPHEVISDYSTSIAPLLAGAEALANQIAEDLAYELAETEAYVNQLAEFETLNDQLANQIAEERSTTSRTETAHQAQDPITEALDYLLERPAILQSLLEEPRSPDELFHQGQMIRRRARMILIARDLAPEPGDANPEYVKGQADLITNATLLHEEDPAVVAEDVTHRILHP